jgi:hypothetical protein
METMKAAVTNLNSVEQCITTAIKDSVDFEWIRSVSCSLHQTIVFRLMGGITRTFIPCWCKQKKTKNRLMSEWARQRGTSNKVMPLYFCLVMSIQPAHMNFIITHCAVITASKSQPRAFIELLWEYLWQLFMQASLNVRWLGTSDNDDEQLQSSNRKAMV